MRCPRCGGEGSIPPAACPNCGFTAEPDPLEELAHIDYCLAELPKWAEIPAQARPSLRARYLRRRAELEVSLGLRPPPLDPEAAQEAHWELVCLEAILREAQVWDQHGWIHPEAARDLVETAQRRVEELCTRLADAPPTPAFDRPQDQLKSLDHVRQRLDELHAQDKLADDDAYIAARADLRAKRRELESQFAPPLPPLTIPKEIRAARWELTCLEELLRRVPHWREKGWVKARASQDLIIESQERTEELGARLAKARPMPPAEHPLDELTLLMSIRLKLEEFYAQGRLVDDEAYAAALADLATEQEQLEAKFGLIPAEELPAGPEAPPPPPTTREALSWSNLWQTLLSERTLSAMLFLGAFLIFTSAVILVLYDWAQFPPPIQLAFLGLFTLASYRIGWIVKERLGLRSSGIAFSAVGSLLMPLDFYAIYLAEGFPQETWPQVWLGASIVCLGAYLITALRIQAEFFGYLVAVAAGNLLCATLRMIEVPTDLWTAGLCILALLTALLAERLKLAGGTWTILVRPFWRLALLTVAALTLTSFGWYFSGLPTPPNIKSALVINWWCGFLLYTFAAARWRSATLGRMAATALPLTLYLTMSLVLDIKRAWYALGWAALTPAYFTLGHTLLTKEDDVLQAHGQTATDWGIALTILAAAWSLADFKAATATHVLLAGSVILATYLWRRPYLLYVASLLLWSAFTVGMDSYQFKVEQYSLGWSWLAILHLAVATILWHAPAYATPVYAAGYVFATLSLLPPLPGRHWGLLTYVLSNWIASMAWSAWLAQDDRHPGLIALLHQLDLPPSTFHWATAVPLPIWLWLAWTRLRPADAWLGLAFAFLAWGCVALGRWLERAEREGQTAWYVAGYACSVISPAIVLCYYDQRLLTTVLLADAALYFASAYTFQKREWLVPAGLTLPIGYLLLLDHWGVPSLPMGVCLALLPAAYLLGGLLLERLCHVERSFLSPLYKLAHSLAAIVVLWGLASLPDSMLRGAPWTVADRLWAAAGQLLLGVTYGLVAWGFYEEKWGHTAAWLGVMAGGLVASINSISQGSVTVKVALMAIAHVLTERGLHTLREGRPLVKMAWLLYRRPLLVAGFTVSALVVPLALIHNLILLGGGRERELWAVAALLMMVSLYAFSARLFRRSLFLWLTGGLLFIPWTLLTHLGWLVWPEPPLCQYALSWVLLAWGQMLLGLILDARAGREYGQPLRDIAHALLPFSLLWGLGDTTTSAYNLGLGVAFYALVAWVDRHRGKVGLAGARFLYPIAVLGPLWAIYLLAHLVPDASHTHYGLLLLALAPAGLMAGRRLRRIALANALPFYLQCYTCAAIGTLVVAYDRPTLIGALLFDVALCAVSTWLFRQTLWEYPATALTPVALLLILAEIEIVPHRQGWALIALGAVYLASAWGLRRLSRQGRPTLWPYATPFLVTAYAVAALGLPPSSFDRVGIFWGYGAVTLLYIFSATWLRQPLFLTPAAVLSVAPYAVGLTWTSLDEIDYGLAIWPGIIVALLVAYLLDRRLGSMSSFPWGTPKSWPGAVVNRLLNWEGLPWYAWGYLGALVSVGLSWDNPIRRAAALGLTAVVYSLATTRFRLRGWLLAAAVAAQGTALAALDALGWLASPWQAALAFLPVTALTMLIGLIIEWLLGEGPPLSVDPRQIISGWSRPLYALLLVDLIGGQIASLRGHEAGMAVTVGHALLIGFLAMRWVMPSLTYLAEGLGVLALLQWMWHAPPTDRPAYLSLLALGYGLVGYGLRYIQRRKGVALLPDVALWEGSLRWVGLLLSAAALIWAATLGPRIVLLVIHAFFGRLLFTPADVPMVQMVVSVLAITGLFYQTAALVERWLRVGYGSVGMLLVAWSLEWFFIWGMRETQWYAIPAGLYLLGVGYLEWRQGNKGLARWIDRAGTLLLLGSSFWQSLSPSGWPYALLMMAEGLLVAWWGSARRQRRFLYLGVVGVVIDVVSQTVLPLLSTAPNRWIVLGAVGIFLVAVALMVEQQLETVVQLSRELRERLETWE